MITIAAYSAARLFAISIAGPMQTITIGVTASAGRGGLVELALAVMTAAVSRCGPGTAGST